MDDESTGFEVSAWYLPAESQRAAGDNLARAEGVVS
jgi:hypothetical protein